MSTTFLSNDELANLQLKYCGANVKVSRKATLLNPERISLGDNVRIDDFSIVISAEPVSIGKYVHIGAGAQIFGSAGCSIEDFAGISPRAAIFTTSDDFSGQSLVGPTIPDEYRSGLVSRPVTLEAYAIIGTCATVMPGVTMHEGAVCGAYGFVQDDCESWVIYAGIPAKAIKNRTQEAKRLGEECLAKYKI